MIDREGTMKTVACDDRFSWSDTFVKYFLSIELSMSDNLGSTQADFVLQMEQTVVGDL